MGEQMIGRILCKLNRHKWRFIYPHKAKVVDYDKDSREYKMEGDGYCARNCGVPHTTIHTWTNGMRQL